MVIGEAGEGCPSSRQRATRLPGLKLSDRRLDSTRKFLDGAGRQSIGRSLEAQPQPGRGA